MDKLRVNKWSIIQVVYMGIFSILLYIYCINAIGILNIIELKIDGLIPARIVFFVMPLYLIYVWLIKNKITGFDFGMQFTPFLLWFLLTCIFGGKSGTNFYLVELPTAILVSGVYLLKHIFNFKTLKIGNNISWAFLMSQYICIIAIYVLLPIFTE